MSPAAVLDALMLGTARRAPPTWAGTDDPLQVLALAGQALRFERPATPAVFAPPLAVADPRAVLSPEARRLLLRLVAGKGAPSDDAAARSAARAMAERRLRPHPFDLPRLTPFVRRFAEDLGPAAVAWARRGEGGPPAAGLLDDEPLSADTWAGATPARQAAFIAALRASEPGGARALLEAQLPLEKADARARLIGALAVGLGPADEALLKSLEADRAPRVREAAARLLARLPGTEAANARLADVVSRISRDRVGLLRRRTTLKLKPPATVKPHQLEGWVVDAFNGLGLDALAEALGLPAAELGEAAKDDDALLIGFVVAAVADRAFASLSALSRQAPAAWTAFLQPGLEAFGLVSPGDRQAWALAALHPDRWSDPPSPWQCELLARELDGPLPLPTARAFLANDKLWWAEAEKAATPLAALVPPALAGPLRRRLAALAPEATPRALLLTDLFAALDVPAPAQRTPAP